MKNIVVAGNVGKDAVIRTTQGGDKITGWSVAVEDGFGQNKRTLWFDCSWFGGRGEKLAQYLTKGSKVTVSGDFSTREHDGKTYLQVRVNDVTLQGGKPEGQRDDRQHDQRAPAGRAADMDDKIPFAPEWR
jgi:single-strand DNA-binding protein